MNEHPILSFLLEMTATGVMIWTSANPDINLLAAFWLIVWRSAQSVAVAAGKLGMRAEVRYFATVKA
jgi:hypothetical protein